MPLKTFVIRDIPDVTLVLPRGMWVARIVHALCCQLCYLEEGIVSRRLIAAALIAVSFVMATDPGYVGAQTAQNNDDLVRRAKNRVEPAYPELAHKMHISGTVKVEVTVAANGTVKEAHVMGGHPVLATAALEAAKKWRFEPAPAESSGVIDFKFDAR
jgi:TonB family protein